MNNTGNLFDFSSSSDDSGYKKWQQEIKEPKPETPPAPLELADYSSSENESSYLQWQAELEAQKKAFESRWAVRLGKRVSIQLTGYDNPIEGTILMEQKAAHKPSSTPMLKIRSIYFTPRDIQSLQLVNL